MRRHYGHGLLLAAVLLGQAGCTLLPPTPLTPPSVEQPPAPPPRDTLPRDQAVQVSLRIAQDLDKKGDEAGALGSYERVLELDPNNAPAMRRLAVLSDRQGKFEQADKYYLRLTRLRPRDADLCNDWGYSYYERNNWKEAEKLYRAALKLDPSHSRARNNLGLALGQQERYPEAYDCFRQCVGAGQAHCNLAFVYWTKSKFAEAKKECQVALQMEPSCKQAAEMLQQLERAGQTPAAAASRRKPDRASLEALAREAASAHSVHNLQLGLPATAPSTGAAPSTGEQPRYQLPPGWAEVPRKTTAAPQSPNPAGPVGGTPGLITWEN